MSGESREQQTFGFGTRRFPESEGGSEDIIIDWPRLVPGETILLPSAYVFNRIHRGVVTSQ